MYSPADYIYTVLDKRPFMRWILLLCIIFSILLGLKCLNLQEDITQFIPESSSHLVTDMELLQSLPAQKQVLITLYKKHPNVSSTALVDATLHFAESLQKPLFDKALFKPPASAGFSTKNILPLLPPLFSQEDALAFQSKISLASIQQSLDDIIQKSMGLEGVAQSQNLAFDPLGLHILVLQKIGSLSQIKNIRVRHGIFMNPDETASLIIAHTSIKTTDSRGAKALQQELETLAKNLPKDIEVSMMASQLHTAANANTIQKDIITVSCIGIIGLIVVMAIFLRTRSIVVLFTIPLAAYAAGAAALGVFWDTASAMTLGFGPVLLGITIDFALHLYYVVTTRTGSFKDAVQRASRPMCVSGITTILAFALLFFSSVPGVRQLSAFVVAGLIVALLLALFFLPHCLKNITQAPPTISFHSTNTNTFQRRLVYLLWGSVSLFAIAFLPALHFEQSLQTMGIRPAHLQLAERKFHETWGSSSSSSLLFSHGKSLDKALQHSEEAQGILASSGNIVSTSLTTLIPSSATQGKNIDRWYSFVSDNKESFKNLIAQEAEDRGFSPTAFDPFFRFLESQIAKTSTTSLASLGLSDLIEQIFIDSSTSDIEDHIVLSIYPTKVQLTDTQQDRLQAHSSRLITPADFGNSVGSILSESFATLFLFALLIIVGVIALILRNVKTTVYAMLPALWGLLIMGGVLGALNIPLGLFSLAGALLVLGHGVDYGIYIVHQRQAPSKAVQTAIFVSGITSLIGFGALTFAHHPALYSMGVSVFSGVLAAMFCALFVLPGFSKEQR